MKMTDKNSCRTAAVMGLLTRGPGAVPAEATGSTPAPTERTIEEITADILRAQQVGGEALLTIGKGLIDAKEKLNHGEWLDWLTERVNYSPRMAQKLMKLAREWTNANALTHLGAAKAFALLVLPEDERENFLAEPHQVDGEEKTVIDMTSRELEKAVRERAEALEAKAKAETDLKAMEDAVAKTMTSLDQANSARDALQKELEALKNRPVEVAVQVDQEAVDRARAEGEAQANKEYKKARAEAQRQVSEANAAAAQTKTELDQARREIENLKFELNRAEKPSPVSADAELAQFKLLFEQAQGIVNQMHGLLIKVRAREDGTAAGNLAAALKALAENVGRCAQ